MTSTAATGSLLGYARVSTAAQDESLQLDALTEAGAAKVFTDQMTGSKIDRPGLDELLGYAREGDTILVYSLSRLSRSVRDLLRLVDDLSERGVGIRSITEPVDTTASSPFGQFTVSLLAALAELERSIIRERTRDGLAAARLRGRVGGQKPVDAAKIDAAGRLIRSGTSPAEAARAVGLGRSTVYRHLAEEIREAATATA